ncbi:hypothetical protein Tco_1297378 [Tanacetum coccineum]
MKLRDFNKDSVRHLLKPGTNLKIFLTNVPIMAFLLSTRLNTQEALTIIENKSKVQTSRNKPQASSASGISTQDAHVTALTKQVEALLSSMNRPVNYIQNGCETCGGPHAYYECQATGGYTQEDVYATTGIYNQGGNSYQPQVGPSVPPPPHSTSKEVERDPESTTNQVLTESTTRVPPLLVQPSPASTSSELPPAHVSSPVIPERNPHQPPIPYPSRLNKDKLQDKFVIQIHSFLQMFKKLYLNIGLVEALAHMPKFAKMVEDLLTNKENFTLSLPKLTPTWMTLELATRTITYPAGIAEDVFHGDESIHKTDILDITCKDHFHEVINVQRLINPLSGNLTPSFDPVVASLSPSLTPFGDSDFILEEIDTFLASNDSTSPDVDDGTFDMEGDIRLIETL